MQFIFSSLFLSATCLEEGGASTRDAHAQDPEGEQARVAVHCPRSAGLGGARLLHSTLRNTLRGRPGGQDVLHLLGILDSVAYLNMTLAERNVICRVCET